MLFNNKKICIIAKNTEITRQLILQFLNNNNSVILLEDEQNINSKSIIDKQNRLTIINLNNINSLDHIKSCDVVVSLLFLPYLESFNNISKKTKIHTKILDYFNINKLEQKLIVAFPLIGGSKFSYLYKKLLFVKNSIANKVKNFCVVETSIIVNKYFLYHNLKLLNKFVANLPLNITNQHDLVNCLAYLCSVNSFDSYKDKSIQIGSSDFVKLEDIKYTLLHLNKFNEKNNIDNFFITNVVQNIKNYFNFYHYNNLFYILKSVANHNITLQSLNIKTCLVKETLLTSYNKYEASWRN